MDQSVNHTESSVLGVAILAADIAKNPYTSQELQLLSEFDKSLNERAGMSFDVSYNPLTKIDENDIKEHKSERARSDNTGDWAITRTGKGRLVIEDFSSFMGSRASLSDPESTIVNINQISLADTGKSRQRGQ